jgi:hypothetical protein
MKLNTFSYIYPFEEFFAGSSIFLTLYTHTHTHTHTYAGHEPSVHQMNKNNATIFSVLWLTFFILFYHLKILKKFNAFQLVNFPFMVGAFSMLFNKFFSQSDGSIFLLETIVSPFAFKS